jgi:hypothetical protein
MAKVWYIAQIFPPPDDYIRSLNTSIAWFMWKGDIFRVLLSTLKRQKAEGDWGLIDIAAKILALLLYRMQTQSQRTGTIRAERLR